MNGIMDYREYLKAQRRIKFLNRSIAQRERNWLWTDQDKLYAMERERKQLLAGTASYERALSSYDIWAQ